MGELTKEQLFFAVFCVESLAERLGTTGDAAYRLLTEASDLLDTYIIRYYEPLHTQGKEYIVNELVDLLREKGLAA